MRAMKAALGIFFSALLLASSGAYAEDVPTEIDYLLTTVGSSNCEFIRNGKRHSAENAEDHLRMKYRRGKRYAPTAEAFIERLASKSSMSRKLYEIHCPGEDVVPSGEWLSHRLAEYRDRQDAEADAQ